MLKPVGLALEEQKPAGDEPKRSKADTGRQIARESAIEATRPEIVPQCPLSPQTQAF
jgi:hypothetical protein